MKSLNASASIRQAPSGELQIFADQSPHLMWMADAGGALLWCNLKWKNYTGTSENSGAGTISAWVHPDFEEKRLQTWTKCLASGEPFDMEYPLRGKGGVYRWFRTHISKVVAEHSDVVYWVGTSTQIEDLQKALSQLRSSKERLGAALIASGTGTFRWDIVTNALEWDEALDRLFGIDPTSSVKSLERFLALVHPEDRPGVIQRCERCREEGADFEMEFRVIYPDGSVHWLLDQGKTFFGEDAKPAYMTGACVDITGRKMIEALVLETRSRMDLVMEASQVGVWFCDLPFDKLVWDAKVKEHFWLPPDAAVTIDTFYDQLHPEDRENTRVAIERSIKQHERYDIEYRTRSSKGDIRWVRAIGRGFYNAQGEPWRFDGVTLDITQAVQARMTLEERRKELEMLVEQRTNKLKDMIAELEAFSYSIAHDMRAPLRSLHGFSEILLDEYTDKLDLDGQRYLRRISSAADRMDRLIQDVLNYSRIVRADLPFDQVDLMKLLLEMIETYPNFAPDKAEISISGTLPRVLGNEAMVTQIFSNLLGNAIKFVAPGVKPKIQISGEFVETQVRVSISDNGIGIERSQHEKIFEMFHQVSSGHEGTGIGLAIVKKAIERMGGKLGLESQPGVGSTFWIQLQRA